MLDRKIADLNERSEGEVEASGTTLTEIYGIDPILAARIIGVVGAVATPRYVRKCEQAYKKLTRFSYGMTSTFSHWLKC